MTDSVGSVSSCIHGYMHRSSSFSNCYGYISTISVRHFRILFEINHF